MWKTVISAEILHEHVGVSGLVIFAEILHVGVRPFQENG